MSRVSPILLLLAVAGLFGLISAHTRDHDNVLPEAEFEYYVSWNINRRSYSPEDPNLNLEDNGPDDENLKKSAGEGVLCTEGIKRSLLGPEFDEPCDSSEEDLAAAQVEKEIAGKDMPFPLYDAVDLVCRPRREGEAEPLFSRPIAKGYFSGENRADLSIRRSVFPRGDDLGDNTAPPPAFTVSLP